MAGARVVVDVNDEAVLTVMRKLRQAAVRLRPFYLEVGEEMKQSTEARFITQTDPDGQPWVTLSPGYAASRRKVGSRGARRILTLDGILGTTIAHQASDTESEWGTNRVYGAAMQYGYPRRNIPARPFLGVSESDRKTILDLAEDHLEGASGANLIPV